MIPQEGRTHILQAAFAGGSQVAQWYIGLLTDHVPSDTDTNTTVAAVELTAYTVGVGVDAANRGAVVLTVATGSVTSTAPVTVTFTAPVTVFGAFLSSTPTKGGAVAGVLGSIERFAASRTFAAGETLDVSALITTTGV